MGGLRETGLQESFVQHIALSENPVFFTERTGCGTGYALKIQISQDIEQKRSGTIMNTS